MLKYLLFLVMVVFVSGSVFAQKVTDNLDIGIKSGVDLTVYQMNKNDTTDKDYRNGGWELTRTNIPIKAKIDDNINAKLNIRYEYNGETYVAEKFYFNEVAVSFSKIMEKPFTVTVGKQQIPFSQCYSTPFAIDPYCYQTSNGTPDTIVGDTSSNTASYNYLMKSDSNLSAGGNVGAANNYTSPYSVNNFGTKTNTLGAVLTYELEKMAKINFSIFEATRGTNGTTLATALKQQDEDNGMFDSYAAKVNFLFIPGLDVSGSYMSEWDGSKGYNNDQKRQISYSGALKYEFGLGEVFGEYLTGKTFNKTEETITQVGLGIKPLEKLGVYGMHETLKIKPNGTPEIKTTKIVAGPKYEMTKTLALICDYIYEKAERSTVKTNAQAVKFRLAYEF